MRRFRIIVLTSMRVAVGAVLIAAGIGKWGNPWQAYYFLASVLGTDALLLGPWIPLLPSIELASGILLVTGCFTRANAILALLLLLAFTAVLLTGWVRGIPLTGCGCFGSSDGVEPSYARLVARNAAIVLALVPLLIVRSPPFSVDGLVSRARAPGSGRGAWVGLAAILPVVIAAGVAVPLAGRAREATALPDSDIFLSVVDLEGQPVGDYVVTDALGRKQSIETGSSGVLFQLGACAREFWIQRRLPGGDTAKKRVLLPQVEGVGGKTTYRLTIRVP
jgi:uncharacterized membrane protein YphA (DoxX/SURF4 family)